MAISNKTRKLLWAHSGSRCAICKCHLTREERPGSHSIVGDECHITARSRGGARYDPLRVAQIDEYDNLIVLCKNDHKRVDDDPITFDAAHLTTIKLDHRTWVLSNQPNSADDVPAEPMQTADFNYIHEDSVALRDEVKELNRLAEAADREAERAESSSAGFSSASQVARRDADERRQWISLRHEEITRVDEGYPLWDRFGFETSVDACGEWCSWGDLGTITNGHLGESSGDSEWRLPAATQERAEEAIRSGLFDRLLLSTTFDTPDDPEETVAPGPFWHYLFGALDKAGHDDSLFYIDSWVEYR